MVSIGMPVYNSAKFVRAAVEQLQCQTFGDFELLISDNCSTDGTWEICREISAKDKRIRLLRHPSNIGALSNFASILIPASGRYFMWAADDDWHHPNFLRHSVQALAKNPSVAVAFCNFFLFNHESGVRSSVIAPTSTTATNPKDALLCRFLNPVPNIIYGLMPIAIARQYFPYEYFDWADAFMIAQISAKYDVEIVPEELFGAGIKTAIRCPTARNGKKHCVDKYLRQSIKLAFETVSFLDAIRLTKTLWDQTRIMARDAAAAEARYREYIEGR